MIELLVVIAIISLLAAILFPVFGRARANAQRSSCASNMRQIATSWLMYAEDYDGRLPFYPSGGVMEFVFPYIKNTQVFRCPSSQLKTPYSAEMTSYYSTEYGMPASYDASTWPRAVMIYADTPGDSTQLLSIIPRPSQICMLAEVRYNNLTYQYGFDRFRANTFPNQATFNGLPQTVRHLGGSNYAYVDGHVKWITETAASVPTPQNSLIQFYWTD